MSPAPMKPDIADEPPWDDRITDYDRSHLVLYLRLLDATAEGAGVAEMANVILGIDPLREPQRAEGTVASHLRRAQWMTEHGYRDLLNGSGTSRSQD